MDYPSNMDPECVPLCDALNALPGIVTTESCCGHGEYPHRIFFNAETVESLLPIVLAAYHNEWFVEADTAIRVSDLADIVYFMLQGPVGPADMPGGANEFAAALIRRNRSMSRIENQHPVPSA